MGKPFKDRTGERYGRLTALRYLGRQGTAKPKWECICDCGNITQVTSSNLATGHTQSCGCKQVDFGKSKRLYPKEFADEYQIWRGIKQRTGNCSGRNEQWYSQVSMCESWFNSFTNFVADMGKRPSVNHSIERVNNSKGYSPDNCIWATPKQQANNRKTNRLITYQGTTKTLTQWAEIIKINPHTLAARLDRHKWSVEKAMTTPVGKRNVSPN